MKLIAMLSLILILPFHSQAEKVNMDIVEICMFQPGESLMIQSIVKLDGSKTRRLYQMFCRVKSKECKAVNLDLTDEKISVATLTPQAYTSDSVSVGAEGASVVYENVTMTADKKSFSIRETFKRDSKTFDEVWRGKCVVQ